jgi:hypothetical protein
MPRQAPKRDSNGDVEKDAAGQVTLVDLYEQRYDIYGGSARLLFASVEDDHEQGLQALATRIENCNLPLVIKHASSAATASAPIEDISWRLLRQDVEEVDDKGHPFYGKATVDFASDHILGRLVARKEKEQ